MFSFGSTTKQFQEVSTEICRCLFTKSKKTLGTWTWFSLSNIQGYYDSFVASSLRFPPSIDLEELLSQLIYLGVLEKNTDIYLQDKFFRLTKTGRELCQTNTLNSLWEQDPFLDQTLETR